MTPDQLDIKVNNELSELEALRREIQMLREENQQLRVKLTQSQTSLLQQLPPTYAESQHSDHNVFASVAPSAEDALSFLKNAAPVTPVLIESNLLKGHTDSVFCFAVLPGYLLATGSRDCTIKIWDLRKGILLKTLTGHSDPVLHLQWLHNSLASSSSDKAIKIWDIQKGVCLRTLPADTSTTCLELLFNGMLKSASSVVVNIWDPETGICLLTQKNPYAYRTVELLPNDRVARVEGKTIKIQNRKTGTCVRTLAGHLDEVFCLRLLPDGNLASGSSDNTIKIWNTQTGAELKTLKDRNSSVAWMKVLPNGMLAGGNYGSDSSPTIWDLKTGTCVLALDHGFPSDAVQLLSNDVLVLPTTKGDVEIWDLRTKSCVAKILEKKFRQAVDLQFLSLPGNEVVVISSDERDTKDVTIVVSDPILIPKLEEDAKSAHEKLIVAASATDIRSASTYTPSYAATVSTTTTSVSVTQRSVSITEEATHKAGGQLP